MQQQSGSKKATILVVDDEFEIREMISDYLRDEEGYTVFDAESGAKALDVLANNSHIDMVLSDINMPEMKGFDLLKEVKERYPSIKRILITAYNVEDYLELALKYDIGNIFVKTTPFNFNELSSALEKLLNNDIFGLTQHFKSSVKMSQYKITTSKNLDKDAEKITNFIGEKERAHRLELVLVELFTNAIFYGIRNEAPDRKELWAHDFVLPDEQAIIVTVASDSEKYAISVCDNGGRLKKSDMLYWLHRQASRDTNGLPLGIYDSHGRGLFIARKYIDRLIVNIDQKRKTEIIIINYFENTYKGYKPLYINEI
ncbi:MAG: response regulator [Fibrobacterota bacterium]|nr:response regulator [Chitinispirillaceae bacterium]